MPLPLPRPSAVVDLAFAAGKAAGRAVDAAGKAAGMAVDAAGKAAETAVGTAAVVVALPGRVLRLVDGAEVLMAAATAALDAAEQAVADARALTATAADLVDQVRTVTGTAAGIVDDARTITTTAGGIVEDARTLTAASAGVVEEARTITTTAAGIVDEAAQASAAAAAVVTQAARTAGTADELLSAYEPGLRRFVDNLSPEEIDAAIRMIDELPKLAHHLNTDVMPILATLDRVGPDIHELLGVTRDLRQAIVGIPGFAMLRRRGSAGES
ncbi:hypothetical protein GCM10010399_28630 [Dactylosporangium fulvum]|uniref:hypothetical protein n=1 Tax=Dactylosporangium fulvum TaxID=53359 RepID=UPI0031D28CF0